MLLAVLLLIGKALGMERLSLRDVAERTLCPFKLRTDIDEHRLPSLIEKVECDKSLPRAGQVVYVDDEGRFNRSCTCTEIYTRLEVEYRRGKERRKDFVTYPAGCMCVNEVSQRSKDPGIKTVA